MGGFDQPGHVGTPPCGQVSFPAGCKLRRINGRIGGGVEVVVKVDAVHGVVLHQLCHALHHIVGSLRNGGVQVGPLVHGADPLRVGVQQAVLCNGRGHGSRAPEPVGIDPGLQRKPPGVGLGQQHVQRVEARVLPLHAGAQVAPREEAAPVKRIPKGAHLCNDGVQPKGQAVIHQRGGIGPERAF